MLRRQMKTSMAGMKPRPSDMRQTARRWCSPKIQKSTRGTKEEITKPKSIIESVINEYMIHLTLKNNGYLLVARANHLCCAFLPTPDSSDCSDAATEPHGYSAPTPIPRRKLIPSIMREHFEEDGASAYRQALSMASIPPRLWWAPDEAADSREKKATIPVAAIYRDKFSMCMREEEIRHSPYRTYDPTCPIGIQK